MHLQAEQAMKIKDGQLQAHTIALIFTTIELKAFQIKEIHAPTKLIRLERVQWPSDRTGASLVFSSCI